MKTILKGFIWLVIIIIIVLGVIFLINNKNTQPNIIKSIATYVEGAVEYKTIDGEWVRLSDNTILSQGDSIETFGDGRVIITIDDGSMIRLNNNSSITLKSMDPKNLIISNNGGEVYSRIVKLDRTFQIILKDTIYESLGTAYLTLNTKDQNGVEVFHSKVKVINNNKETIVDEGKMFFVEHKEKTLENKISIIPEEEIKNNNFIAWNNSEDIKIFDDKDLGIFVEKEEIKGLEETEVSNNTIDNQSIKSNEKVITLTSKGNGDISWIYNKVSDQGFKVVWSKNSTPTYPTRSGDQYIYLSESNARYSTVDAFDGSGTYYVRVCEYLGGKCGVYSNQIKISLVDSKEQEYKDKIESTNVNSINISKNGNIIYWTVNGNSPQGFKVVYSKTSGPTYPTRSSDKYFYLSDPSSSSQELDAFDGEGKYYVRVCEYLGGKCGVYSNQIEVNL